ncbi:MAG: GC-type dockerin domain-anchored protein, partial [Phycisphaerales bacterium]
DGVFVGAMFLPQTEGSIFRAFAYQNGVTIDLSEAASGIPGPITEVTDVSNTGLMVGTIDVAGVPQAVLLTPAEPACTGDFNGSGGQPTVQDIFDFLTAYFNGDLRADLNRSGTVTVQDIFDYLSAYFAGC